MDSFFVGTEKDGSVLISDFDDQMVRRVSPDGVIRTIAGTGPPVKTRDVQEGKPAAEAHIGRIAGVVSDGGGNVFMADSDNNVVWKVTADGKIARYAGNYSAAYSGDGGLAINAGFATPWGLAIDSRGNLYISDENDQRIRKVSPSGVISTFAGNGKRGFSGDGGVATQAALDTPQGIAVDSRGNLYIADLGNFRIRLVSLDGIIRTVAGTGGGIISPADGISATQADIGWPYGVAVDGEDNLYLGGSILQKVSADGRITPINPSLFSYDSPGYHGEDAPASAASFGGRGVAIGRDGEIYAAGSQVIWVVRRTNQLTAVNAASGRQGEIAPGEILVVYGNGIGPKQLLQATPDFDGTYPTQLAGTEIRVNGVPAPLVYTSSSQASAVVPYGTVGSAVAVTAFFQGRATAGSYPALASSAPGVFTADGSGRGQAAVLNQDGSLNSGSRPASAGDVIVLYVTGEGKTTPAGEDGRLVTGTSRPELPVSAFVGGQAARVIYAGTAPGEVAGLMQVNVQVPPGIVKGDAIPLLVQVGGVPSQPDVTVAIR